MELFHTSQEKIERVTRDGLFCDFLCFAESPYFMSYAPSRVTYKLELDHDDVIEAKVFFYRDDYELLERVVAEVMDVAGCDEDTAQDLLAGKKALIDVADEFDMDKDFDIQRLQAEAARVLGFRAVEVVDEQGAMWLVSMEGREHELELVE